LFLRMSDLLCKSLFCISMDLYSIVLYDLTINCFLIFIFIFCLESSICPFDWLLAKRR
jgi:hypothetical protein